MARPIRALCTLLGAAMLAALSTLAFAQAYPTKPVTIIVPWPPGGPSDIAARPMAKGLTEDLKQTFIIDNRGGAGGNIGSAMVAKAAPDGYTLLITSSAPIVINPSLYKQMPFDPPKDLAPITNLLRVPLDPGGQPVRSRRRTCRSSSPTSIRKRARSSTRRPATARRST